MRTDISYSVGNCYNTFPFPIISAQRKSEITQGVFRILEEREKHSDKTLAQLYDPDKMPEGLREAHRQNDEMIEKCWLKLCPEAKREPSLLLVGMLFEWRGDLTQLL